MIAFKGSTHSIIAIAFYMFLNNIINLNVPFGLAILCLILGSLLPDIDHPRSTLGRYFFPISAVVKHRGFTHSFIGALLFSLPVLYFGLEYYFLTIWGYLTHLIADTLTPMGVPWFRPFFKKKYSLDLTKTGSTEEKLIALMFLMFILDCSWK